MCRPLPADGAVLSSHVRRPEYFEERPLNTSVFEGLSVRILCDITAKVSVPLSDVRTTKATVKLKHVPYIVVLLGEAPRRVSGTSIQALGLRMSDDAPGDDDDDDPIFGQSRSIERAAERRTTASCTSSSDEESDEDDDDL